MVTKKRWCLVLSVGMVVVEIAAGSDAESVVGSDAETVVVDIEIVGVGVVVVVEWQVVFEMGPVKIHWLVETVGKKDADQVDNDEVGDDVGCCGVEVVVGSDQMSGCCDAAGGDGCDDVIVVVQVDVVE